MDIWIKAKEQTDKDIRTFEDICKPKLLDFHKVTGEDITINLNNKGEIDKPIIHYTEGNNIVVITQRDQDINRVGCQTICNDIVKSESLKYADDYNIFVVRTVLNYWDQIYERLTNRLKDLYKDVEVCNDKNKSN